MRRTCEDIFIKHLPKLDLHGYDRESARVAVEQFIADSYKLNKKELLVVHGIGLGIIREQVHNVLRRNKYVLEYKLHSFNLGCTIIKLK